MLYDCSSCCLSIMYIKKDDKDKDKNDKNKIYKTDREGKCAQCRQIIKGIQKLYL